MDNIAQALLDFEKEHCIIRIGNFVGNGDIMYSDTTENEFTAMFASNEVLKELTTQVASQALLSHKP